jgi:hypothetical protein
MTTQATTKKRPPQKERSIDSVGDLFRQLERLADEAGDRISQVVDDADIRQRLSDAIDALDDVRLEVVRRLRGGPATTPLDEMTVKELHHLAGEREIEGRSSMNKAELIDALRTGD